MSFIHGCFFLRRRGVQYTNPVSRRYELSILPSVKYRALQNTEWILLLVIFNTGVRIVKKIANRIDSRWGDIPGGKETCGSLEGHFLITDARSHLLDLGSRNKGRSNQWSQVISHI